MEDYLELLNQQQRDAVLYTEGPQLVIAGAGSGKTRVLTYKIVHLLGLGYEPYRILALTFTNKAAKEMRERIEKLVGAGTSSRLWMGTFHSIFSRILRQNAERIGFKSNFTIYDATDSKSLVKTIIKDMALDDKIYKPSVVVSAISTAKNALISPDQYALDRDIMEADRRAKRPRLQEIYRVYCDRCFLAGAMDFDDLLYYTNVLLRDNPDVLHHYQEFFKYVLVDEYQDTNFAQHLIISQLSQVSQKLCVVGDDAQSIYSFRGANIRNILNLRKSYPALRTFKLEQNYRSTQNIINAANSLIEKNREQIPKQVFSLNDVGSKIEVFQCHTEFVEAYDVSNKISQLKMKEHDSFDEYAILYRTNAQSRVLEEALRKRNIPYRIYGGLSFYQRKEIKDAISYFRLAINPNDDEALKRIINFPARGIGETTVNKLLRCAIDNRVSAWEVLENMQSYPLGVNSGTAKKLMGFHELIQGFRKMVERGESAYTVAHEIITRTQLLSMLLSDRTPESISKQENLQELLSAVSEFVADRTETGEGASLADYLGEISLSTDQDTQSVNEPSVTLMTVHAAKGLEFNNVFVVGVEEELFPSALSADSPMEIEEERRLLYVAITRAKNNCFISYASSRYKNGQTKMCSPSRFIKDMDSKYLRLNAGTESIGTSRYHNPVEQYYDSMRSRKPSFSHPLADNRPSFGAPRQKTVQSTVSSGASGAGMHGINELQEGMLIEHSRFGRGRITEVLRDGVDEKIVVDFDATGEKKLLLKFARFNIIK